MLKTLEIIVGTYEEYLLGYRCSESTKDNKIVLTQSFATRSHTASIRCVATCGKYLASGGADDRVFVYDMKTRKEIQILSHHKGTVNSIAFTPDCTHLLTGGDDEHLYAVRLSTFQVEGAWKKGRAVTRISCHPSGKLALTLSSDLILRTWNLVKGRMAYAINLKSNKTLGGQPDCVAWSQDGEHFALSGLRVVEVWNTESGSVIKSEKTESKPTCLCWISEHDLVIGCEDGKMLLLHTQEDSVTSFQAHTKRVKDVAFTNELLATASSSGEITLWTVDLINKSFKKLTSTNIGCRPTCVTLVDITQFGDDYNLKKESVANEVPLEESNRNEGFSSVGKVTVCVEEDDLESDVHANAGKWNVSEQKEEEQHNGTEKKKHKKRKFDSSETQKQTKNGQSFEQKKTKKKKKIMKTD